MHEMNLSILSLFPLKSSIYDLWSVLYMPVHIVLLKLYIDIIFFLRWWGLFEIDLELICIHRVGITCTNCIWYNCYDEFSRD